jgi:hypothetical protein
VKAPFELKLCLINFIHLKVRHAQSIEYFSVVGFHLEDGFALLSARFILSALEIAERQIFMCGKFKLSDSFLHLFLGFDVGYSGVELVEDVFEVKSGLGILFGFKVFDGEFFEVIEFFD